jgi:hypothetical protein
MRFRLAVAAAALLLAPAFAAADGGEGLGLYDEIGTGVSVLDGAAAPYLRNPVLEVCASIHYVFESMHGVGVGFDFGWDVSGAEATAGTYMIDFFYIHPWRVVEDWEVTPIFGAAIGWVDVQLSACVTGDCDDEAMMRARELDRLDAFLAGGRVGFGVSYVLDFLHIGFGAWVRVMAVTGDEDWNVLWSQMLMSRVGFRFDL